MKILILTYHFPPLNNVAALRPLSFALTFSAMGHEVTVVTGQKPGQTGSGSSDDYPFQLITVRSPLLARLFSLLGVNGGPKQQLNRSRRAGIRNRLNQLRTRRGLLLLGRLPDLLDLLIKPTKSALKAEQWDLVLSSYAPRYCHAVALWLRQEQRAKYWVADYRDLWSIHHQFKGLFPFTYIESKLDHKYLTNADLVTTVSIGLKDELSAIRPNGPISVVTNGYDKDEIRKLPNHKALPSGLITLVYTGTIYPSWGSFRHFLLGLQKFTTEQPNLAENIRVLFVGADLAKLEERVDRMGLSKFVQFKGLQPREFALRCQNQAHILLFFDPSENTGITTGKIFEYICANTLIWRIGPPTRTAGLQLIETTNTGRDLGNDIKAIANQLHLLAKEGEKPSVSPIVSEIERFERSIVAKSLLNEIENEMKKRATLKPLRN